MTTATIRLSNSHRLYNDTQRLDRATITARAQQNRSVQGALPVCNPDCYFCCGPETD